MKRNKSIKNRGSGCTSITELPMIGDRTRVSSTIEESILTRQDTLNHS